jgi:activator of HSP90 ATPase
MYLDPKAHASFTGAKVKIGSTPGSEFKAFDGMITGKILHVVPKRLIVQSWRATHWKRGDMDSILVLSFWPEGNQGRIELVHVNVADHDVEAVRLGWRQYYWRPWREYLSKGLR